MTTPPLPLAGIKILELEGIGPGPFAGHYLASLGADVTLVKRPAAHSPAAQAPLFEQGKTVVMLNLKDPGDIAKVKDLVANTDALIEGMRPGVMEKLGLGPEDLAPLNPALVYGRVTGWGQDGPLASAAGHDLNYIALSGALHYSGQPGDAPFAPPSLIGDIAGGALYLIIGVLSAIMGARQTGKGQVVDAAMVDGSANMMNLLLSLMPMGMLREERGQSMLDGPHWYNTYKCSDDKFITIGALEPQFYAEFLAALDLTDDPEFAGQMNPKTWPSLRARLVDIFIAKPQKHWCDMMEGTDICFAPVLSPMAAAEHPHIKARGIYKSENGGLVAAPAPRFLPLTSD